MYVREIREQEHEVQEMRREETLELPSDLDYSVLNIPNEAKEKLMRVQPRTISALSRIPGITPVTVFMLLRYVKAGRHRQVSDEPLDYAA